jgi:sulfur-oxidizing protein SoxZ
MTAHMGAFVSAKPRVTFKFAGARKGDTIELAWVDNQGRSDAKQANVK